MPRLKFLCGSDYMQVCENLRILQGCKAPAMQSGFYDKGHHLNNFTKIGRANEREGNRKENTCLLD